ncbi:MULTISPECIES: ABC transporter permease [Oceanibaculum]|jgi:peptide/nickel transport system permease protein|uniref:ABC transporter inner membrane protein n=2 Tax=Oceanibaculum indicum TaxID=526216 RepID=K2KK75_9PROT|nr:MULTISPECIES: ABC transporter permease [Oceanibaculum]EKE77755.1 ABC transporter inner membrane protein [Oceanibaculum indicum P24]MCH2395500.1 ABC transporter permease [Oceanibaculum sp.]RKQ73274.1 peptide/nickel transport system permease protein [Oceanibaculum indicum]
MFAFISRRILATIPVMGVVALVVFLLLRLTPGDPAAIIAGDAATPAELEAIRERLGLNLPIYLQFFDWVFRLLQGDFGTSILSNTSVGTMVLQRLEPTLALATTTIIFAVLVAVPMGVIAAWKHGTWIDRAIMMFSVIGFSVPVFVLGYLWIYGISINLRWLPVQGYRPIANGFWPFFERLILPTLTLSVIYIALIARITRASVLEILDEDYIRTARAKGLTEKRVLLVHALRNAAVPIVTIIGIGIALLISGVVVTESVFNLPGLGRLTVDAVLARDYPVIQGIILIFAFVYVIVNLVIDLSYTLFDPRIRY